MDKNTKPPPFKKTEQSSRTTLLQASSSFIKSSSTETYCDEKENVSDRICASELFSLFTADIIKKEVIFVR